MTTLAASPVTIETRGMILFFAAVWFLYLVLKPVYLFPHGMPQISDAVLLVGLGPAMVLMLLGAGGPVSPVVLSGALFALLTAAVNLVNYIFYPDTKLVLSSLYYIYNFMIFLFAVYLFRQDAGLMTRLSVAGIVIALFIQIVAVKFFPDYDAGIERLTGGFTNPNQLAYWALLSAAMLVFLKPRFGWVEIAAIGMAGYLQILALSKAGLITYGLFLLLLVFLPQTPRIVKMLLLFTVLTCASYFVFSGEGFESKVTDRLQSIGTEADDSLAGRGYDRLADYPEYLIFGAGEGAFARFRQWGGPDELHSGLATILFSYGILGFAFFATFLYFIFERQSLHVLALLVIVLLFSVTSQTIRFTHTWVFLGIAYGSFLVRKGEESSGQDALPAAPAAR